MAVDSGTLFWSLLNPDNTSPAEFETPEEFLYFCEQILINLSGREVKRSGFKALFIGSNKAALSW